MTCDEVQGALSAYLDGLLPDAQQKAIEGHLASCPSCTMALEDYRRIGRILREDAIERAPPGLQERIRAEIGREASDEMVSTRGHRGRFIAQAATLLLVAGLSATGGWYASSTSSRANSLTHDIATAHVRSLLQDNLTQVASSDRHVVKPWFAGRIDFAAPVQDLSGHGFPLKGGRLDYVGDQRVAAVVYMRRQHVISLFAWPSDGGVLPLPFLPTVKGYNVHRWTSGGMNYWAISDLNVKELAEFQALFTTS
jgi:anti-sigma factor RsiW